jgi:DNA-binding NtrC family response regulator
VTGARAHVFDDPAQSRRLQPAPSLGTAVAAERGSMKTTPYRTAVVTFKRELIATTLRDHAGNRTRAARALGIPRTYLVRLIHHLDVTERPSRSEFPA